ncbi:MAG: hypothetical protein MUO73_04435 [Thermoplasmata archaeon]|nr:hypothetical protein [Thermoplasmata archaeon]
MSEKKKKQKTCWMCGRTNKDIREEISDLSKNSSMISFSGGINGTSLYCCAPCRIIIHNSMKQLCDVNERIMESNITEKLNSMVEKTIKKSVDKINKKIDKLFMVKTPDEKRDVA